MCPLWRAFPDYFHRLPVLARVLFPVRLRISLMQGTRINTFPEETLMLIIMKEMVTIIQWLVITITFPKEANSRFSVAKTLPRMAGRGWGHRPYCSYINCRHPCP